MGRRAAKDKTEGYVTIGPRIPRKLRDELNKRAIDEGLNAEDILSRALARELGREDLIEAPATASS